MRTLQKIFKIIIIPIFRTTELCSGEDPRKRPRKVLHGGFVHNLACKWLKILSSRHFYLQTGFKKKRETRTFIQIDLFSRSSRLMNCVQTKQLNSGAFEWNIHFWLGRDTSQVCKNRIVREM